MPRSTTESRQKVSRYGSSDLVAGHPRMHVAVDGADAHHSAFRLQAISACFLVSLANHASISAEFYSPDVQSARGNMVGTSY